MCYWVIERIYNLLKFCERERVPANLPLEYVILLIQYIDSIQQEVSDLQSRINDLSNR